MTKDNKIAIGVTSVGALIILFLLLRSTGSSPQVESPPDKTIEPPALSVAKPEPKPQPAKRAEEPKEPDRVEVQTPLPLRHLSGIDPKTGELVVQQINIWKSRDRSADRSGLAVNGRLPHGSPVRIAEVDQSLNPVMYRIISPEGINGWVSELFVVD